MSGSAQSLRSAFEDIRRQLEAEQLRDDPGLKTELMTVYRSVDSALGDLGHLKDEMRQFAERWKAHHTAPPVSQTPVPVHEDRLGASTFTEKAWTRISQGEYAEAEGLLLRALELSPADIEAQTLLGWAQMLQDKLDSALMHLQDVLSRDPENALARVNVGYICLKKGIFGEAIEHLSNALRQGGDARARLYGNFYLGLVYTEREMYDDAYIFFDRAITLGPRLVEAYFELGHAYWLAGQQDEAVETWKSGAGMNGYNPWSKRCLDLVASVERGERPRRV